MILLALPALAAWFAIYWARNRWVRLAILAVSPLPIYWVGRLYQALGSNDPIPPQMIFVYAVLVLIVGVIVAVAPPRRRNHECHSCGYDLTGTPQADHCPECGRNTPDTQARLDAQLRAARRDALRQHHDAIRAARADHHRAIPRITAPTPTAAEASDPAPPKRLYRIAGRD